MLKISSWVKAELGSKKWTPSTYYRGLEVWDGTVTATEVYEGVP